MKVVRKGGEELGLVGGVEIHYIYTVYNFGPYLGLFLSILSAVGLKDILHHLPFSLNCLRPDFLALAAVSHLNDQFHGAHDAK